MSKPAAVSSFTHSGRSPASAVRFPAAGFTMSSARSPTQAPASHVAGHPQGRSAPFGVLRPAATGLATAFFRLYLLDTLAAGPARPATVLAAIAAERLPFANGAFGRALQSLLDGGYVVPAAQACVALTALGAAERMAER